MGRHWSWGAPISNSSQLYTGIKDQDGYMVKWELQSDMDGDIYA